MFAADFTDELLALVTDGTSDYYEKDYLDRTYGGAYNEGSECYREGKLVKLAHCQKHD